MKRRRWQSTWIIVPVLLGLSGSALAEKKTLKATMPWEGEGRVFQIGPEKMLFLGAFEGIIYVETSEGHLNEGFVECPASQRVDIATKQTSARGHCMITASGGDVVYADWTCKGEVGRCKGNFTLVGGTGKFKGVTGSSELLVRSPLRALVADMGNGKILRVGAGLAELPKLTYELAASE